MNTIHTVCVPRSISRDVYTVQVYAVFTAPYPAIATTNYFVQTNGNRALLLCQNKAQQHFDHQAWNINTTYSVSMFGLRFIVALNCMLQAEYGQRPSIVPMQQLVRG
jgi:hypothetical protein